ncbi:MAG: rod shape-determining protein MreC [Clostridia bacterium]|nr:rod shape-determining protein MreC [Clostridia bacterium]
MYKNKKVGIIGIIITVIVLIILVILTNTEISKFSSSEGFFGKLVMPMQNGLTYLKNKMANNKSFFEDINNLKEENKKLEEENNKLKEELKSLEIIKAENATLRSYNNMSQQYTEYKTIPGYIINRDISNLSDTMVINVGTDDGVSANMAVITSEGLVGYTLSVTNKTAKVKPIIDASGSTSAQISTSRESVIAKGILR